MPSITRLVLSRDTDRKRLKADDGIYPTRVQKARAFVAAHRAPRAAPQLVARLFVYQGQRLYYRWVLWPVHGMSTHKYYVGQTVFLASSFARNMPGGAYVVTKKLPEHDGEYEYRVKSMNEPHERVVRESDLQSAVDSSASP